MQCTKVQENLLAYLKAELDPHEILDIEQHVNSCQACQKEKKAIYAHQKLYKNLRPINTSNKFSSLLEKIEESNKTKTISFFQFSTMKIAASIIITISIILYISTFYIYSPKTWNYELLHGKSIRKNNRVSTSSVETLKCKISKNIELALGTNTKIHLLQPPYIFLEQGEVFVKVKKGKNLCIKMKSGDAFVKGTVFSIAENKKVGKLKVFKGAVYFKSQKSQKLVQKGEEIEINKGAVDSIQKIKEIGIPWWEEDSLSINLRLQSKKSKAKYLFVDLKNFQKQKITFSPLSSPPNLILHIKTKTKSYSTPLSSFIVSNIGKTIHINPGKRHTIKCNIAPLFSKNAVYSLTVIYRRNRTTIKRFESNVITSIPLEIKTLK